jgi:lipopolysaccharide export system permease protein
MNPDPNDSRFQARPQSFRGEMHRRLSDWLYPIVFALIGLAVASDARSFREARFHPLVTTMGFALIVRWAGFFVANEGAASARFVPAMYAVPLVAIAVLGWLIATNRRLEVPTSWAEGILGLVETIHDRISSMRLIGWATLRLAGDQR